MSWYTLTTPPGTLQTGQYFDGRPLSDDQAQRVVGRQPRAPAMRDYFHRLRLDDKVVDVATGNRNVQSVDVSAVRIGKGVLDRDRLHP
ncbi:MAG: hypothetical protein F4X17_19615 [Gemmatimonadetes bacterium]|nr:hypothetical protein [Gemmatimonadota bacterium]